MPEVADDGSASDSDVIDDGIDEEQNISQGSPDDEDQDHAHDHDEHDQDLDIDGESLSSEDLDYIENAGTNVEAPVEQSVVRIVSILHVFAGELFG